MMTMPFPPRRLTVLLAGIVCLFRSPVVRAAEPSAPQPPGRDEIAALVEEHYPDLESLYVSLHREPELSHAETRTSKRLAAELRELGYEVTEGVGGHGVVAILKNGDGKTLLIRTDLDALPVKEQTGAAYASKAKGKDPAGKEVDVMHACGHDAHIACLVGTARAMTRLKDHWRGTLVLIGQPAEEVVQGAAAMLKDGLYERFPRPDFALALHVDAGLEAGKVGFVPGASMAGVDSVDIVVRGVGGHGAYPHKTKDPVVIAAQIILALQTIASREVDPLEGVVVTVGSIHGGLKRNVIPDEVTMQLTVRTYKDEVREQTIRAIERIVKNTARAAGVPEGREPVVTVKQEESSPVLFNTPELAERVTGVFRGLVGEANVVRREPVMAGEDFGQFGRVEPRVPVFMYWLGSVPPERVKQSKAPGGEPLPGLHSPFFLPEPNRTIRTGVLTMTGAALDLLK